MRTTTPTMTPIVATAMIVPAMKRATRRMGRMVTVARDRAPGRRSSRGSGVLERLPLLPPALDGEIRRRLDRQLAGGRREPGREVVERECEDVADSGDPRLGEETVLLRAEPSQVQQQGLVAPRQDIVRRRVDLVGEVLASRRRLGYLEEDAGREHALPLEAGKVDRLDAGQLGDRRHAVAVLLCGW